MKRKRVKETKEVGEYGHSIREKREKITSWEILIWRRRDMMEEERNIGSYRQAKDGGREGDGKRNREM